MLLLIIKLRIDFFPIYLFPKIVTLVINCFSLSCSFLNYEIQDHPILFKSDILLFLSIYYESVLRFLIFLF